MARRMNPAFHKATAAAIANLQMQEAMAKRDRLIREAVAGSSTRQVASIVGISHQRVAQIVKEGK